MPCCWYSVYFINHTETTSYSSIDISHTPSPPQNVQVICKAYLQFQRVPHLRFVQQSCSQMGNPWGHWKIWHIYKNKLKWSCCSQMYQNPLPFLKMVTVLNTYFGDSGVRGRDKDVGLAKGKKKKETNYEILKVFRICFLSTTVMLETGNWKTKVRKALNIGSKSDNSPLR